jgi:hypothetical protein
MDDMGARMRIPLRVLLPGLAVSLVAAGAVTVGVIGVSGIHGYLMRQADNELLSCASSMLGHGFVAPTSSAPAPGRVPGACDIELLSAGGRLLNPPARGTAPGPAIPGGGSWLAAHLARPVTVPGAGTGGPWQMVIEAVRYQPQRILYVYGPDDVRYLIGGPAGHGRPGMLVVMAALAGSGRAARRAAEDYAAAAGLILALLAGAALALTRTIMRTDGKRGGRRFGTALAGIPAQMHASRTAEAAARRSAAEMPAHPDEVTLELRAPPRVRRAWRFRSWRAP